MSGKALFTCERSGTGCSEMWGLLCFDPEKPSGHSPGELDPM